MAIGSPDLEGVREDVYKQYERMAWSYAQHYYSIVARVHGKRELPFTAEDLFAEGWLNLLTYADFSRGVNSSYAYAALRGGMLKALRRMGFKKDDVRVLSLDEPESFVLDQSDYALWGARGEDDFRRFENGVDVAAAMEVLADDSLYTDQDRGIIDMMYRQGISARRVSQILGMSSQGVLNQHNAIMAALRSRLVEMDGVPMIVVPDSLPIDIFSFARRVGGRAAQVMAMRYEQGRSRTEVASHLGVSDNIVSYVQASVLDRLVSVPNNGLTRSEYMLLFRLGLNSDTDMASVWEMIDNGPEFDDLDRRVMRAYYRDERSLVEIAELEDLGHEGDANRIHQGVVGILKLKSAALKAAGEQADEEESVEEQPLYRLLSGNLVIGSIIARLFKMHFQEGVSFEDLEVDEDLPQEVLKRLRRGGLSYLRDAIEGNPSERELAVLCKAGEVDVMALRQIFASAAEINFSIGDFYAAYYGDDSKPDLVRASRAAHLDLGYAAAVNIFLQWFYHYGENLSLDASPHAILESVKALDHRAVEVVKMHAQEGKNFAQIGAHFQCSRQAVTKVYRVASFVLQFLMYDAGAGESFLRFLTDVLDLDVIWAAIKEFDAEKLPMAEDIFVNGMNGKEIAGKYGCAAATAQRYKRSLLAYLRHRFVPGQKS